MKRFFLLHLLIIAFVPATSLAAGGASGAQLSRVEVSLKDIPSLQNGAKLFINYCLSCHSAKYLRYERLTDDLQIPKSLVSSEMLPRGVKIGSPMLTTMTPEDGEAWFGVAPPDLSLVAKLRGEDWLYAYLKGFYWDESAATGWNNTIFPNVAMPNVLYQLQGINKVTFKDEINEYGKKHQVIDKVTPLIAGSLSEKEFDEAIYDLTNFLYYMAEPVRMVRIKYGLWVMFFLGILIVLTYFLKKEYWRDVT